MTFGTVVQSLEYANKFASITLDWADGSTPVSGNLIIITCGTRGSANLATPSGYTLAHKVEPWTVSSSTTSYIWYKFASASESNVTVTDGNSAGSMYLGMAEVEGPFDINPVGYGGSNDEASVAKATGIAPGSTGVLGDGDNFVYSVLAYRGNEQPTCDADSHAASDGFTSLGSFTDDDTYVLNGGHAYKVATTTAALDPTHTWTMISNSSLQAMAQIVVFRSEWAFGEVVQTDTSFDDAASSISAVFDTTPAEGNLMVACHFTADENSIAPTGFTEAVALTDGGNTDQGAIYYKVAGSSESKTVTCTTDASDEQTLTIFEVAGPFEASPMDQAASAGPSNTSSRDTGITGATSQNDELAVALVTMRHTQTSPNVSAWSNSFIERTDTVKTDYKSHSTATKLLTSTGTVTTTATLDASYVSMGGVATFKKQVGAAVYPIPEALHSYRQRRL